MWRFFCKIRDTFLGVLKEYNSWGVYIGVSLFWETTILLDVVNLEFRFKGLGLRWVR